MSLELGSSKPAYTNYNKDGKLIDKKHKHEKIKKNKDNVNEINTSDKYHKTENKNPKKEFKTPEIVKEANKFVQDKKINIPLDQLNSVPDFTKFVKDQLLEQKGNIDIPKEVLDKLGISTPEEVTKFVDDVNKSEADPDKSNIKIGYNKPEQMYQSSFGDGEKSANLGASDHKLSVGGGIIQKTEIVNPDGTNSTNQKNYDFGIVYNNSNIKKLADNTPANEQKFKDIVKNNHNSITETDALKLRQDLINSKSPKEEQDVMEKFLKDHNKKDTQVFFNSLGLEDKSVRLKANIDGKMADLEFSKQEIKAAYNNSQNGGEAKVGKGSILLKAKIDGKIQEVNISKESFTAAFETKEVGGRADLSKNRVNLQAKIDGKSVGIEVKKGEFRVNSDVGPIGGNIRAVRKREESIQIKDDKYICTLGKENGGGLGIKADVQKIGVKGEFDLNYKTAVTVTSPAEKNVKEVSETNKSRLNEIAGQIKDDKTISVEIAQKLLEGETVNINYERINKSSAGLKYQGVSGEYNHEGKKDDVMTVSAIPDLDPQNNPPHNKVRVKILIDKDNTIEGSLGSGVKLSAKKDKGDKLEIEFECDLNREEGKEAYKKASEGIKESNLEIHDIQDDTGYECFSYGYEDKTSVSKGLSSPVLSSTITKTNNENLNINTGYKEFASSRTLTQEGKLVFDKEKKEVNFTGNVDNGHNLIGDASLSFKINDTKVKHREIEKYTNKTGIDVPLILDLNQQKNVSIDINVKINSDNLKNISNKPISEDISKSDKKFMENIKQAETDEDKVKVLQSFIESDGQRAFTFIQGLDVLSEGDIKITGQKSDQLKSEVEPKVIDKKIEDASVAKHPKQKLKDIRSNQSDIKEKAETQIEYLQSFLLDNPKMSRDDKQKMVNYIQTMLDVSLIANDNIEKINNKIKILRNE